MDSLVERLKLIAAWHKRGGPTPKQPLPGRHKTCTEAAARIAEQDRLLKLAREALRPLADRQTIAEMLADPSPSSWAGLSPDERIADVVARKEKHDRDTMNARQALTAMEQADAD